MNFGSPNAKTERLFTLLCDAELAGLSALSPQEQAELAQLQMQVAQERGAETARAEAQGTERAIAGLALMGSASRAREPMPAHLFAKLEQAALSASTAFASNANVYTNANAGRAPSQIPPSNNVVSLEAKRASRGSRAPIVIAWIAAAACLLLAVGVIYRRPREVVVTKTVLVPASVSSQIQAPITPATPASPGALREALLARVDTTTTSWSKTKDPASQNAGGDVVWNEALQQGFMRFAGLAKNDPTASQYQLWIFDDTRDARYPVDGGVFDVDSAQADPKTGDVIVAISAKVRVGKPSLFAVTVEKPGGVVVSKRERIVLTAPGENKPATERKSPEKHG